MSTINITVYHKIVLTSTAIIEVSKWLTPEDRGRGRERGRERDSDRETEMRE